MRKFLERMRGHWLWPTDLGDYGILALIVVCVVLAILGVAVAVASGYAYEDRCAGLGLEYVGPPESPVRCVDDLGDIRAICWADNCVWASPVREGERQ